MIHKTRLTLLSLGCVTASASASYDPHFWGGLGIGLASNTQHMRQYDNTGFPILPDPLTVLNDRKASLNNLSGAGFFQLGWGINLNKFHLGAFFDLPGGSLKDSFSLVNADADPSDAMVRVKSKFFGYGGGIRLGYRMDKFLLFTSLGAISRRFKVTWDQRIGIPFGGGRILENTIISDKKAFTALVPGVGLEYWVTPCMALGMVANVQFYPSKTFESDGIDQQSGLGSALKLRPRGVSGILSASYKFNL